MSMFIKHFKTNLIIMFVLDLGLGKLVKDTVKQWADGKGLLVMFCHFIT